MLISYLAGFITNTFKNKSKLILFVGCIMKEDDVIKTIFNFFIIDLIIFAIIAFIVAFIIGIFIEFALGDIGVRITSFLGFILLIILMWWNYKYRYQKKLGKEDTIELLKLRYAKGDISKEEFEQIKKDISK